MLAELFVRAIDPQFGEDNIYRNPAQITISLGPVMIATVVQERVAGVEAEVVSENNFRPFLRKAPLDGRGMPDHLALQKERPAEFIFISASISNAVPRALELIGIYRNMPEELRPKWIVVGGWHAGDSPKEFLLAGADIVVHGEGEPVVKSIIDALKGDLPLEKVPGISYWSADGQIKRNPVFDKRYEGEEGFIIVPPEEMDLLPYPNFGLVRWAKIEIIPISRTRGCGGKCRFCRVKGEARVISPKRLAEQIESLCSQGYRRFFLVDDRSEEDMEGFIAWLQEIVKLRRERKIRWIYITVQSRLSAANDEELLRLMHEAGIQTVAIGVESVIPEELRAMKKPMSQDLNEIVRLIKVWKKHGFFTHAMLIFGYPMPSKSNPFRMDIKERVARFWYFIKEANPDTLQVLALTPILGTEDWRDLESQNRIFRDLGWQNWDGLHVVFRPDEPLTAPQVQRAIIYLQDRFYSFLWLNIHGIASVALRACYIGLLALAMPFVWALLMPFKGLVPKLAFRPWHRVWRNTIRRLGAQLIVLRVKEKLIPFLQKLEEREER